MTLTTRGFSNANGRAAAGRVVAVVRQSDDTVAAEVTTDARGNASFDVSPGLYYYRVDGYTVPFEVPLPAGSGLAQAPAVARDPVTQALGASPFTFTCPAGEVVSLSIGGGAGVSVSLSTGGAFNIVVSGTGGSLLLTPGEQCRIAWTTAPIIRTRTLWRVQ